MKKAQRLLNIMMTVNARKKFNIKDLTEEFQVSKRTILRDLHELSELGFPLYSEWGVHGGYRLLKDQTLPAIHFSNQEAVTIFFIVESLKQYKMLPFDTEVNSALKKFYHYLPSDSKKRIDQLRNKVMFTVPQRYVETPFLSHLLDASLDERIVTITYESEKGVSVRDIQCIGVFTMNGFWYCPAYCYRSRDYRIFRVDRVLSLLPSQEQHPQVDTSAHHIQDWIFPNQGEQKQEEEVKVIVALTRRGVLKSQSDSWLSSGLTILEDGSGRVERRIKVSDVSCMVDSIINCGTDAVVVEPPLVRDTILQRMAEISALYAQAF